MHWHVRDFWTRTSLVFSSSSHKHHHHKSSSSVATSSLEFATTTTVPYVSTLETTVYTGTPSFPSVTPAEFTIYATPTPTLSSEKKSKTEASQLVSSKIISSEAKPCKTCTSTTTMSTILSTLTLSSTIFATLSTAIPSSPPDIPSAIRGLSDCSQDVLFPLLGTSQCNPADFPCICVELDHLGARKEVSDKCPEHVDEYNDFAVNTCGKHAGVVTVTGSSSSESPVSITTISVIISTGGPENVTSSAPFNNGTAVAPTKTESVVLPSETSQSNGTSGGSGGSNSGPSGSGSAGAGQGSGSSPTQPENPEFSGAAVSEFGNGNLATFAGFMGMMWLAFAEL